MDQPRTQKLTLSAGQQCVLRGDGMIRVSLLEGVVDVAGVVLSGGETYTFALDSDTRSVLLLSLEGGAVSIAAAAGVTLDIQKHSTELLPLISLARRLSTSSAQRAHSVAVLGTPGSGKTLAAHMTANHLVQHSRRQANPPTVYLVDANGVDSCVVPGTISVLEVLTGTAAPRALPTDDALWPGYVADPQRVSCSFWLGLEEATLDSTSLGWFTNCLSQAKECADAFAKNKAAVVSSSKPVGSVVYDLPSPHESLPIELYTKRMVEVLKPSVVVLLCDANEPRDWMHLVQDDLARSSPTTEVVRVVSTGFSTGARRSDAPRQLSAGSSLALQRSVRDYFGGTVPRPLSAARMVAPLSSLRWLQIVGVGPGSHREFKTNQVVPTDEVARGRICAVSLALLDAEALLANVAGVVLVESVDELHDECVLIAPSGDDALPNNVLVLPLTTEVDAVLPWSVGDSVLATASALVAA